MKITKILLFTFMLGVFAITSCQKDPQKGCTDATATNYDANAEEDDGTCTFIPTITLIGDSVVTIAVASVYTDSGATAEDQDSASLTVTTDLSNVNTSETGTYTVTYTASNSYGTATATRTVNVVIDQSVWSSNTWDITHNCGATAFPLASPPTIAAGATSSDLEFSSFFTLVGGTANATISDESITFPSQVISITGGDVTFSGTGTMNSTATEIVVQYTYDNTVPILGGNGTCTATYTKQ
jgi:hypothetical protein